MRTRGSAPVAALVAMVFIWGYAWVMNKIALRHASPLEFSAWRVGIGCAVLFLMVKLRRGRTLTLPSYRMAVLLGFLQVALFVALTQLALALAGPGKTSVLVFTMPFWMIVFAHFILHEKMRGTQWVAVALAFAGLVLIVAPWQLTSLGGSLLAVASGAVWAITAVLSKRWPIAAADPLLFTAWQLLFGFVPLVAIALAVPGAPIQWTGEFVVALLFSSVLGSGVGWWLWTYVLANTRAGIAGLNSLGIPVIAVTASAIQLGERPPAIELAGMALIGVALALLAWIGLRRRELGR
ncbi:MAG TPA: DMT family transporter [Usitatibacter sp.]|nr:DMT family transporter [Usitatibacter sp.]